MLTKADTQIMVFKALTTIKNVLNSELPGNFREESLVEIRSMTQYFDAQAFIKESGSYSLRELEMIYMACYKWLKILNIDIEYVTIENVVREETGKK